MTDYQTPETALLDLDWLLDQASLFITTNAIDSELAARFEDFAKVSGCSRSMARESFGSAPAALGDLRKEVRRYLAHVSVEEIYDPYLDQMGKLELACRKAEVDRRLGKMLAQILPHTTRQAA
jgi:hypothetical protein